MTGQNRAESHGFAYSLEVSSALCTALFAVVVLLLSGLVVDPTPRSHGPIAVLLVAFVLGVLLVLRTPHGASAAIGLALCLGAVQTSAIGLWAGTDTSLNGAVLLLIESKTLVLFAGGVVAFLWLLLQRGGTHADNALRTAAVLLLLIPVWAVVTMAWGGFQGGSSLAYLRNFGTPGALVALTWVAWRARESAYVLSGVLWGVAAILTAASAVELAVGSGQFSQLVNVDALAALKGPVSTHTDFLGYVVPRLRSLVGEPINASYTFCALGWWAILRNRYWLAGLLLAQNLLTFAKGGLLVYLITVLWMLATAKYERSWRKVAAVLACLVIPLYVTYISLSSQTNPALLLTDTSAVSSGQNSAFTHAAGLVSGLRTTFESPLGAGVGNGGNFADIFQENLSHDEWISSGAESAIGVLGVQLGVLGLSLLVLAVVQVGRFMRNLGTIESRVGIGLILGWLFASLFQENAWGPQAALPIFAVWCYCLLASRQRGVDSEGIVRLQLGRTPRPVEAGGRGLAGPIHARDV